MYINEKHPTITLCEKAKFCIFIYDTLKNSATWDTTLPQKQTCLTWFSENWQEIFLESVDHFYRWETFLASVNTFYQWDMTLPCTLSGHFKVLISVFGMSQWWYMREQVTVSCGVKFTIYQFTMSCNQLHFSWQSVNNFKMIDNWLSCICFNLSIHWICLYA